MHDIEKCKFYLFQTDREFMILESHYVQGNVGVRLPHAIFLSTAGLLDI